MLLKSSIYRNFAASKISKANKILTIRNYGINKILVILKFGINKKFQQLKKIGKS